MERWGIKAPQSIKKMELEGTLTRCKKIPGVWYTAQSVLAAEEGNFNSLSPIERRRLERENKKLEEENKRLRSILSAITMEASRFIGSEVSNF